MGKPKADDFANVSKERARFLKVQAEIKELDLAIKRGELVPADQVSGLLERLAVEIRAKFIGLPSRIAPQIVACNSIAEVKEMLERAIFECLDELAAGASIPQRAKNSQKSSKAAALRVG